MKFVIEHLDSELFEWSLIEYKHISKVVKGNVIFTNVKNSKDKEVLEKLGDVEEKSVSELGFDNICVMDMNSENELKPREYFDYYVFGGILGDDPPQHRTEKLIKKMKNCEKRNLGKEQMSTDTAVIVSKKILDGTELKKIEFKDGIEIEIREGESVMLPYRYVVEDGKGMYSEELVEYLKKKEGF
tara:strand:- start:1149 stop:1706 length:558 start_codon:yes stop_codon:yes gene_type:complete